MSCDGSRGSKSREKPARDGVFIFLKETRMALGNRQYKLESSGTFVTSGIHAKAPLSGSSLTAIGGVQLPLARRSSLPPVTSKQSLMEASSQFPSRYM